MRKLRQWVVHEFSQGPRSTKLAALGFELKHSGPRISLITTMPCYLRTMNCFLLCTQECSYMLLEIVTLIVIIIVIMWKIQVDNSLCDASGKLKSAHPCFKASPSPYPFPHPLSTPHAPSTWNTFPLLSDCKLCPSACSFNVVSSGTPSQMMSPVTVGQRSLGQC